ncbi:MAG: hypothetical protein RLZZ522_640 [Verrucomicrobiota bacterium]|jgi:hypothetical protein
MNCRLPLILIAAPWGGAAAVEPPSVIRFATQGEQWLSGSLESVAGDKLIWNAPVLKQPTAFWTKSIRDLTLPPLNYEQKVSHEASLHLTNGDLVRGQLCSVTDDRIVLDTWYGGRLEFRRAMIKEMGVLDQAALVYSGPAGLDGWIQTAKTPTWKYENGALCTSATRGIGRDVGLPDECSVAFEMSCSESLSLSVHLFADDLTTDAPKGCYQINCQGGYVSFSRLGDDGRMGGMGGMEGRSVPEFRGDGKVQVELRASRSSGNVSLYVSGRHAANWRAQNLKGKFGKGIQFVPQNGTATLRIAKIKVTAWDGEVEGLADENMAIGNPIRRNREPTLAPESAPESSDKERMKLRNGDSIGGEVVAIMDGIITVKTPFAEVKLPVGMVRNILLKPASLEEPIRRNGDVRAWFPDGASMVFRLDSTTKDSLTGSSQTFGTATFKLAAFNRIEFNIHDPEINDLRAKDPF